MRNTWKGAEAITRLDSLKRTTLLARAFSACTIHICYKLNNITIVSDGIPALFVAGLNLYAQGTLHNPAGLLGM